MSKKEKRIITVEDTLSGEVLDIIKTKNNNYVCVNYRGNLRYKLSKADKEFHTLWYVGRPVPFNSRQYRILSRLEKEFIL